MHGPPPCFVLTCTAPCPEAPPRGVSGRDPAGRQRHTQQSVPRALPHDSPLGGTGARATRGPRRGSAGRKPGSRLGFAPTTSGRLKSRGAVALGRLPCSQPLVPAGREKFPRPPPLQGSLPRPELSLPRI